MKPQKIASSRLLLSSVVTAAFCMSSAFAQTFTYTSPATSGTETWASGTNWSATPVSSLDTELIFSGTLNASAAIVSNNDVATPPFQLNKLTFNASGTTTAGTYLISGNQLDFRNNTATTGPTMVFSGGITAPALTISNSLLLSNDLAITATTSATLSGAITGASNLSVTGGGTVSLGSNSSTFGGVGKTITVQGGSTLRSANGGSNQPVFGSTSNTIILNGGTITMVPNNDPTVQLANALTLNTGGANFINVSPGSGANRGVSMSGLVTGSGGFTFASSIGAPLALTNTANSLSGTVGVSSGTLFVVGNSTVDALGTAALGLGGGNTIFTGSAANAGPIGFSRAIALTGNASLGAGAGYTLTHTGTLTGSSTLSINTSSASQFTNAAMANRNINSGATSVVVLNGNVSGFSGGLSVNQGTLRIGSSATLPSNFGLLTLANTAGANLDLNGRSITVRGLTTGGTTGGNIAGNSSTTANTFTIDTTGTNRTYAGVISDGGSISLNLSKIGTNTQTLSSANTYTGTTTVSGGTLLVGANVGSLASLGSGAVSVASGATLGGNGTLNGATTINNGGILSVGSGAGSMEFAGNLTLTGVSTSTVIELGGTNFNLNVTEQYDRIKLTGATAALNLGGALNVSLINSFVLTAGQAFGIIQVEDGATVNGTFAGLAEGASLGIFSGQQLRITYLANFADTGTIALTGGNDIALYTIPEPSSALLLLGGLGILLARRRR